MKKLILLIVFALFGQMAIATHIIGGDVTYKCIDATTNKFEFTVIITADCPSNPPVHLPDDVTLEFDTDLDGIFGESSDDDNSLTLDQVFKGEISPTGIADGKCPSGSHCVIQGTYKGTRTGVNLPADFQVREDRRNIASNTIGPSIGTWDWVMRGSMVQNTCDNSPVFKGDLHPVVCLNSPICLDLGATDSDGDNLSYTLVSALGSESFGSVNPILFSQGRSATNPLPTVSGFNLNPSTGEICFTPTSIGSFLFKVQVTARDANNNVTSIVFRDSEVRVINCVDGPTPFACMQDVGLVCEGDDVIINANCSKNGYDHRWTLYNKDDWDQQTGQSIWTEFNDGTETNPLLPTSLNLTNALSNSNLSLTAGHCYVIVLEVAAVCDNVEFWSGTFREFCYGAVYNVDYEPVGCDPVGIQLTVDGPENAIYKWTGPNGFSSNLTNPFIANADKSLHEGFYRLTAESPCPYTELIYVSIPDDCCDAGLRIENDGCGNLTATLDDHNVDVDCQIWRIDGEVVSFDELLNFNVTGTSHNICVNYMGINNNVDPPLECCHEICIDVDDDEPHARIQGPDSFCLGDVWLDGGPSDPHFRHTWEIYNIDNGWANRVKVASSQNHETPLGPNGTPNVAGMFNLSTIFNFEAGKCYAVILDTKNYCDGVLVSSVPAIKTICIRQGPGPFPDDFVTIPCGEDCIDIGMVIEANWTIEWQGGETTEFITVCPDDGMSFPVTYTDQYGCSAIKSYNVEKACCPEPCFTIPQVCIGIEAWTDVSCMDDDITSYRWILYEYDAMGNKVAICSTASAPGPVSKVDINGMGCTLDPNKSYHIELEAVEDCNGVLLTQTMGFDFTPQIPMVQNHTISVLPGQIIDLGIPLFQNACTGEIIAMIDHTLEEYIFPIPPTISFSQTTELEIHFECCIINLTIQMVEEPFTGSNYESILLKDDNVQVKPNPSDGIFEIRFIDLKSIDNINKARVLVYDSKGALIINKKAQLSESNPIAKIDLSNFADGAYTLKITKGENVLVRTLILKK